MKGIERLVCRRLITNKGRFSEWYDVVISPRTRSSSRNHLGSNTVCQGAVSDLKGFVVKLLLAVPLIFLSD